MIRRTESQLIADLFLPLTQGDQLALGLEDDAALVRPPPGDDLVVTSDAMAEGVHFTRETAARDVGGKLLRVNLSDLAAMGAAPCAYTLVAALPPDLSQDWIEEFAGGLREDQERYGIRLIGGDTVAAGRLVLSLTMLGTVRRGAELRRSGARPGDTVYVSGAVGDAGLGLRAGRGEFPTLDAGARAALRARLDRPSPRLELGRALPALATAAIDISDGLVADLARLCAASGVGAEVRLGDVPASAAARAALAADPAADVVRLGAGDDYELLFTAPPRRSGEVQALSQRLGLPLTAIGKVSDGAGVRVRDTAGREVPVPSAGYAHF